MTDRGALAILAFLSPLASLEARTVTTLGEPHQTFGAGRLASFVASDHNGDAIGDSLQDMTFRFTFTTPSTFRDPGYVVFETGAPDAGASLLLLGDRLVFLVGGQRVSSIGVRAVRAVSRELLPGTSYEVVFALQIDQDGNGISNDTRGAIYLNGEFAVEPAHPGAQVTDDIRRSGIADWAGTGAAGYGEADGGALYIREEGTPPTNFSGPGFVTSDGTLDSPLEFFADTFLDTAPAFRGTNILLITADDMNWDAVGALGGPLPTVTPRIDRLAAEGMIFRRAHVTVAVCQPSRESLLTGLYPHNNGGEGFEPVKPSVTTLVEVLDNLGYRLGILSKTRHVQPASEFRWDTNLFAASLAQGRNPERFHAAAKAFMQGALEEGRPFFLMANSNDPHRPFHGSAQEAAAYTRSVRNTFAVPSRVYAPDEVKVPGFLPDLPDIRREIAQYYSSCRRCDDTVGRILDALDEVGARQSTIVIFLSDNGIAVPFAKTNVWLHSTRTPLIVRWPGVVAPGSSDSSHFIVGVDLMPTLLDALGVSHSLPLDGLSFLPLLRGSEIQPGRERAVTVFHETAARRRYEMRSLQGERHGYIFNAWSNGLTVFRNESQNGLTWNAMTRAGRTDPAIQVRVDHFSFRTPEEFYDYSTDLDALDNLIDRPSLAEEIAGSRQELLAWMERTGDPLRGVFEGYLRANPLPGQGFRRGDCNGDGSVNISDAITTLLVLFRGEGARGCQDACDSNDDGKVDISDAIETLAVLFLRKGSISPPGSRDCGVDPTDDTLGCETYERCP